MFGSSGRGPGNDRNKSDQQNRAARIDTQERNAARARNEARDRRFGSSSHNSNAQRPKRGW